MLVAFRRFMHIPVLCGYPGLCIVIVCKFVYTSISEIRVNSQLHVLWRYLFSVVAMRE